MVTIIFLENVYLLYFLFEKKWYSNRKTSSIAPLMAVLLLVGILLSNYQENSKTEVTVYACYYMGELFFAQEKRNHQRLSKKDARANRFSYAY